MNSDLQDRNWRRDSVDVQIQLYHHARDERKILNGRGLPLDSLDDQFLNLEVIADWVAGLLSSRDFARRFSDEDFRNKLQAAARLYKGWIDFELQNWAISISNTHPATAAYAYSVFSHFLHIYSELGLAGDQTPTKSAD